MKCNLCCSENVAKLGNVGIRPVSVTSDSRLCNLHSNIYACRECGHLQKIYTNEELSVIKSIYENYAAHYLSEGHEQLVFPDGLSPRPRTYYVIERCMPFLPESGELLDFGSGNGAVLKSASELLPEWRLYALDITERYKEEILKIPNVERFYSGVPETISSPRFDLIALWQTLEHIAAPLKQLSELREIIRDGGYLLVQVPDIARNPFDFAVIDHYSHFTRQTLLSLFYSCGFFPVVDGYEWIYNCNTLLLRKGNTPEEIKTANSENFHSDSYLSWVNNTLVDFERAIKHIDYAIFGTGMASIWLSSQLSRPPLFFIDEDKIKSGKKVEGIPIITPEKIKPRKINIIMPFTYTRALLLSKKLKKSYDCCAGCNFILTKPHLESFVCQ